MRDDIKLIFLRHSLSNSAIMSTNCKVATTVSIARNCRALHPLAVMYDYSPLDFNPHVNRSCVCFFLVCMCVCPWHVKDNTRNGRACCVGIVQVVEDWHTKIVHSPEAIHV